MSNMTAKKLNQEPAIRYDLNGGGPNKRMISCSNEQCDVSPKVTGENERIAVSRWERRA